MIGPYPCPVQEELIYPLATRPVLSVVIPTYNRPQELSLAVECLTYQMTDALLQKVEIVISDNASNAEAQEVIRKLAASHPNISYYLNAENMGAVQIATAHWRARGEWVWLFGDDDLLAEGGLAHITQKLEEIKPGFVSLNRCVVDKDLKTITQPFKHNVPSAVYENFFELLKVFGCDQLSFFTSQICKTDLLRAVDPDYYLNSGCTYAQIALYFEACARERAYYESEVFVIHRWHLEDHQRHTDNFRNLTAPLARCLCHVRDLLGLPNDMLEQIGGDRSVLKGRPSKVSFVDNILLYLWSCMALEANITPEDWDFLEAESDNWRPDHKLEILKLKAETHSLQSLIQSVADIESKLNNPDEHKTLPDSLKRLQRFQRLSLIQEREKALKALDECRKNAMDRSQAFA